MGKRGKIILAFERQGNALALVDQLNGYVELVFRAVNDKPRSLGIYEDREDAVADFHVQSATLVMLGGLDEHA